MTCHILPRIRRSGEGPIANAARSSVDAAFENGSPQENVAMTPTSARIRIPTNPSGAAQTSDPVGDIAPSGIGG
jgi:hypothetical protein